jgi:hypothetical protein
MIRARAALFAQLRQFFDSELREVYRWEDAIPDVPIPADPDPKRPKRPSPFGKHKEVVSVRFGKGKYALSVASPSEHPPLGLVSLNSPGDSLAGPLEAKTWQTIGAFIRENEQNTARRMING